MVIMKYFVSRIRHNPLQESPDTLTPMPDLNSNLNKFGEENSLTFRFRHILKVAQNAPYEKVMEGWFENYLDLKHFTLMETVRGGCCCFYSLAVKWEGVKKYFGNLISYGNSISE